MTTTRSRLLASLATGLVAASAAVAHAQPDPKFAYGKQDDVKDVKDVTWTAKAEGGLIITSGNSRSTTLTGSASGERKDKDNKLALVVTGNYARATTRLVNDANGNKLIDMGELTESTATSARNASAQARYDRFLSEKNSLYLTALGAIDTPAGKDFQGGVQLGYSRGLVKTENHEVLAEVGYDLSYLNLTAGGETTIHSARAFAGYKGKLTAATALEASLEGLFNLNSLAIAGQNADALGATRVNANTALTTSLSSKISLSVSFAAKFNQFRTPLGPVGGLPFADGNVHLNDRLDTISKVSLIVKFL
ncbi:MAG: DUF481 domain-containing protein [Deltaproteobacteria bacterium]|nr:DUF481 domain-containing protein [Deltaproteobacteria bacterium]